MKVENINSGSKQASKQASAMERGDDHGKESGSARAGIEGQRGSL